VIKEIRHDPGRGAPMAVVSFRDPYRFQKAIVTMVAAEGSYTGQFVYAGKKAKMAPGNIVPLSTLPEGSVVCNVELRAGDRGKLARASGEYCTIKTHDFDKKKTSVELPSGNKIVLPNAARAMVGLVAGGGRVDKPLLKAGNAFYKFQKKRNEWPKVTAVCMNPVDHPHGGGKYGGFSRTVARDTPAGAKVGLIAARRTGLKRGTVGAIVA
jgi:large subunit ribosomal protein L8e